MYAVAPGDVDQAGRFEAQGAHMVLCYELTAVDDGGLVLPVVAQGAAEQRAAKEDFDLVEAEFRSVKLVHKAGRTDVNGQTGFLVHFTAEVVGERGTRVGPAAGGAPQVALLARIGVDQQKAVFVQQDGARGEADGAVAHGGRVECRGLGGKGEGRCPSRSPGYFRPDEGGAPAVRWRSQGRD